MKINFSYTIATKIFFLCFVGLSANLIALSQSNEPRAFSINNSGVEWKVKFRFDESIPPSNVISFVLLNASTGTTVKITDYVFFGGDNAAKAAGEVEGISIPSINLNKDLNYFLVISVLKKKTDGSFETTSYLTNKKIAFEKLFSEDTQSEKFGSNQPVPGTKPPKSKFSTKPVESKAKKDSDVYIAGELGGSRGKKVAYSTEIKIAPTFTNGRWYYTPVFFNLNASTSPDADPDNMEFGGKGGYVYPFDLKPTDKWKFRLTGLDTSFGGKIESERDFDNTNLIFNLQTNFVVTPIPLGKKATLTFDPYIGTELGKNLNSPLAAAKGDCIARLLGGTNVLIDIPIENSGLQGIVWETSYTRRWLLSNELGFKTNDANELVLTKFGKSPRDYFQSKVEFTINKFLNPYISYEWGEVPPSYKLLDHRFRVGFVYKFKLTGK